MFEEQTQPYDRITQLLQSKAMPNPQQLHIQDLAGIASGRGTDYFGLKQAAEREQINNSLNILKVFEAKKAAGDRQAQALDARIQMFTGGDPEGTALMLQELHNDPEDIDPSNAYQVMSKLAGIAKRTGYVSPVLAMEKQKQQLELQKMRADIGATNALKQQRLTPGGGGDIPAAIQVANALQEARARGDTQRYNDLLETQKIIKYAAGIQPGPAGTAQQIPGYADAATALVSQTALGEKTGGELGKALIEKRTKAEEAILTVQSNAQARSLLDSGIISGIGAEYITNFGRALNQIGFNATKNPVANTQAFIALRAKEVGRIIKLFGAGTGLSDADREFATNAAAGDVSLDETSIRRILDISDTVAQEAISLFNNEITKVPKAAIPYDLTLQPNAAPPATAPGGGIKFLGFE